ncbi:MAG: OB-fold nucleic acid binding domain-containing protein [Candidatus Aenigmarchaeota archaeon]|nr:OB-fold nucleic acid binding domain-containing protein [Candidatus Aenigmarchaeota archaeon]
MENKVLLYLALASSLVGLLIIYIASQNVQPVVTPTGKITFDDVGKNVQVCGKISSLSTSKTGHTFLILEDHTGEIDAIVFNTSKINVDGLKKGDNTCLLGKIDNYEGKLEIIPKEIR